MPERIQLKDPGSSLEMLVSSVKPEVVERNDYYLFANGQKELLVPQSSVKAQLERLGIQAVEQMNGRWVKFGRSQKMSRANKPYWDIDWSSGAETSKAANQAAGNPPAANAVAPSAEPARKPTIREAYKSLTEWVIKEISPLYATEDWTDLSAETIASITATLFIQACKSGKVE